jgi:hypothetical protein
MGIIYSCPVYDIFYIDVLCFYHHVVFLYRTLTIPLLVEQNDQPSLR